MAEDIAPAFIDLDANAANQIRNLPPGSPTVYTVEWAVSASPDGRLYIRGDYEWTPEPASASNFPIRRLPDSRLAIERLPLRRISVNDATHCFEHWHGEYLFQIVGTAEVVEQ